MMQTDATMQCGVAYAYTISSIWSRCHWRKCWQSMQLLLFWNTLGIHDLRTEMSETLPQEYTPRLVGWPCLQTTALRAQAIVIGKFQENNANSNRQLNGARLAYSGGNEQWLYWLSSFHFKMGLRPIPIEGHYDLSSSLCLANLSFGKCDMMSDVYDFISLFKECILDYLFPWYIPGFWSSDCLWDRLLPNLWKQSSTQNWNCSAKK